MYTGGTYDWILSVGVPRGDHDLVSNAGALAVLYGGALSGFGTTDNQLWHQNSANVAGVAEVGDRLGEALS
jgi:hypothetical protein